MDFYVVPDNVVSQYQNYYEGDAGLFFRKNNNNDWVVNVEVAPLWPGIDWGSFTVVSLDASDFPQSVNPS